MLQNDFVEVIEKPRHIFRLKPLTTSLLAVMATFIFVLLLVDQTGINPVINEPVLEKYGKCCCPIKYSSNLFD